MKSTFFDNILKHIVYPQHLFKVILFEQKIKVWNKLEYALYRLKQVPRPLITKSRNILMFAHSICMIYPSLGTKIPNVGNEILNYKLNLRWLRYYNISWLKNKTCATINNKFILHLYRFWFNRLQFLVQTFA